MFPLDLRRECLAALRLADPRVEKVRIEQMKGGLLQDSYEWVLKHDSFVHWYNDQNTRLLWIKGDAGKGKTMLLCGIIDQLQHLIQASNAKSEHRVLLSYFFCQWHDVRLNGATAILRGLIYLLLCQQPSLESHVLEKFSHAGSGLFNDAHAHYPLFEVLFNMLRDPLAKGCFLIVDALDECEHHLPQFLSFVAECVSKIDGVKWIVSSRNRHEIQKILRPIQPGIMLSLESNSKNVYQAVGLYIRHKVSHLDTISGDRKKQQELLDKIHERADGTFLWAAAVVAEIQKATPWNVFKALDQRPPNLHLAGQRMRDQIQGLEYMERELCRRILSATAGARYPPHITEIGPMARLPEGISSTPSHVEYLVISCGSFLTIRDDRVHLIHWSLRDYLCDYLAELTRMATRG